MYAMAAEVRVCLALAVCSDSHCMSFTRRTLPHCIIFYLRLASRPGVRDICLHLINMHGDSD